MTEGGSGTGTKGRDGRSLTREELVAQLAALGLLAGDVVMVHASLRALGPVCGGGATVARALLDSVSPGGTLLAYVSWRDSPYEATLNGRVLDPKARANWPVFDPRTAPPYPGFGALNAHLLALPGARRSPHPDASMAAIGPRAGFLVEDHPLGTGYGPGSPLERFAALPGKVLLLGAPFDSVTLLHYAEAVAKIPGKRRVRYEVPVSENGGRVWRAVEELDSNGILDVFARPGHPDAVETIVRDYIGRRRHRAGPVGLARCHLFDAGDLVRHGIDYLESRFGRRPS